MLSHNGLRVLHFLPLNKYIAISNLMQGEYKIVLNNYLGETTKCNWQKWKLFSSPYHQVFLNRVYSRKFVTPLFNGSIQMLHQFWNPYNNLHKITGGNIVLKTIASFKIILKQC